MVIKPDLKNEDIVRCLRDAYGLNVEEIYFLPLGADFKTTVYRITTSRKMDYFLKLRSGEFFEASVLVPKYLADVGIKQIIPPIPTKSGQLWEDLGRFKAILYPYIDGHNSIQTKLSEPQWIEFGATLRRFHTTSIPKTLTRDIPQEAFPSKWREAVTMWLKHLEEQTFEDLLSSKAALFLKSKRKDILNLVKQAEELARPLENQPLEYILCHADIHGWNLMLNRSGSLYIVDWDTLIFAPKERDLMFIGAGLGNSGRIPVEEERLFYQGYGQTHIHQAAIAYYRFERIIEDIAEYCEHIFLSKDSDNDRIQSFEYLQSHFLPNSTLDCAHHSYKPKKKP